MGNYNFSIFFRAFKMQKTVAFVNLIGLSLGISCCLIIFLYVKNELTYNRAFKNADRIARMVTDIKTPDTYMYLAKTPDPLAEALSSNYPEVSGATRLTPIQANMKYKGTVISERNVYLADSSVFPVFSFPLLSHDGTQLLVHPLEAVITSDIAKKYFGEQAAVGQTLRCNNTDYKVKGVITDLPSNSDIKINILLSRPAGLDKSNGWIEDMPVYTFLLFRRKPDVPSFEKKIAPLVAQHIEPVIKAMGAEGYAFSFKIEMLSDLHYTRNRMEDIPAPKGNKQEVYMFSFLAIFVLVIAMLNYMNLLAAKAPERAREVGVKKVNGAGKWHLFKQFMLESLFFSLVAMIVALIVMLVLIPWLNNRFQINIQWEFSMTIVYVLLALIVVCVLSGIYPAFIMSNYNPITVLKGKFSNYGKGLLLRKIFTTFQFVLTIGMIAGVIIIYRQMIYLQHYDLGFDKEHLLSVKIPNDSLVRNSVKAVMDAFKQQTNVTGVSAGTGLQPATETTVATTFLWEENGHKREMMSNFFFIDENTLSLLKIGIVRGRNIAAEPADKSNAFLVNEAFVKNLGLKEPIGRNIEAFGRKGRIVDVIKNFSYHSIHTPIEPLVLLYNTGPAEYITLKLSAIDVEKLHHVWSSYFPDFPFEYFFVDEAYDRLYKGDKVMGMLFALFTVMIAFISFLGLYALLSVNIFNRRSEIGMRKVLGASVTNVFLLLYKDFLIILGIAVLLAIPLTWLSMSKWLENFAYRISIQWWVFLLSGLATFIISLFILYYKILRTASEKPVRALRVE